MNPNEKILTDTLSQLTQAIETVMPCIDWARATTSAKDNLDMAIWEAKDLIGDTDGCDTGTCSRG